MNTRLLCTKCQREQAIDQDTRVGGTAERGECEACGKYRWLDEFPAANDADAEWSFEREQQRYGGL